ncbi:hypothetical protein BAZOLSSOX_37 [uncultured Gammaproteobacteria bacterium]|nr:hypothetical protein BAZOLSSOX_37 [uncultured Gammaproteobacteria bacterium]
MCIGSLLLHECCKCCLFYCICCGFGINISYSLKFLLSTLPLVAKAVPCTRLHSLQ